MNDTCPVCGGAVTADAATCPACGFKLAGSTQSFKPLVLDETPEIEPAEPLPPAAKAVLRVIRGPQTGMVFELGDKELCVGRSPQCDVFLNDMTVSREHAVVRPAEGGFEVADCNSYNGVWIGEENVDRKMLAPGDIVQIGTFCLVYEEE